MDVDKLALDSLDYPQLAPEEHRWIEERVGRRMTNDEAQLALRDATIEGAFQTWMENKGGNDNGN